MRRRIAQLSPELEIESLIDFAWTSQSGLLKPLQIRSELESLLATVFNGTRPRQIMEIGSCHGGTLFLFTRLAAPDACIISLDLPGGEFGGGAPQWKVSLLESFKNPSQEMHLVRADSHDPSSLDKVKTILDGRELDVLFIDGDHSYAGVKDDFEMYSPLVCEGGIVAFHDIVRHRPEAGCHVDQYWNEIKTNHCYQEFVSDPQQRWAGIGVLWMGQPRGDAEDRPRADRPSHDEQRTLRMQEVPLTVIIPAYNVATSLRRTLDSVVGQTLQPSQVIVINDGSTDDTSSVAAEYGERVTLLEQGNQGQGAARNAGLRIAHGDFIAFLDADDYWLPGFLQVCVDFLQHHPEAIAVSTASVVKKWGRPDQIIPRALATDPLLSQRPQVLENFFEFWAQHDHVRTGSNVIRRSVIERAGPQRGGLRISQDLEYWGYLATFGKWGFIPRPYFVTDGTPAAAGSWMAKYETRRRLCPSVEQWEARITPVLRPEDGPGFRTVRGRVAGTFAHAKILAGDAATARAIVDKYGADFSPNWSDRLMRYGARSGRLGWGLCCQLVRFRERSKSRGLLRRVSRQRRLEKGVQV